jgi:hypothetical protein
LRFPLWTVLLRYAVQGLVLFLFRLLTRPVFALALADIVGLVVVAILIGPALTLLGLVAVAAGLVGWRHFDPARFDRWVW